MANFSADDVKALRERTGAGMMDCKRALEEADGNVEAAVALLRERGLAAAAKRAGREAREGVVASYLHPGGRVGVLIEVNCETDFVARTEDFQQLAKDLCLHIASANPLAVSEDMVPADVLERETAIFRAQAAESGKPAPVQEKMVEGKIRKFYEERVLLVQPFVKDDSQKVGDLVKAVSGKLGERVVVRRFVRYEIGGE
jgi:elongation factor Ts